MSFLYMPNNLYTLHFQNLQDVIINSGASSFNTEYCSWRTTEWRWRHDLFPFSFSRKRLKLTAKELSGSCNYAFGRDSNKKKKRWLSILNKNPGRKFVTYPREIWTTFSILREQTHRNWNLQPGAKLGYNLGKDENDCMFSLNFKCNTLGNRTSAFGRCWHGILSDRAEADQQWESESLGEEPTRTPHLKWLYIWQWGVSKEAETRMRVNMPRKPFVFESC